MADRCTFLRGLVSLPLIGGGVTLIGNPTAAAVPVTVELLERYSDWLAIEDGETLIELAPRYQPEHALIVESFRRRWCHDNGTLNPEPWVGRFDAPPIQRPSTRAAVILSAAGVPISESWRL